MNLYQEILADILSREEICIEFPNLTNHASELVEMKSYQTLKQIKEIIEDDELKDCLLYTSVRGFGHLDCELALSALLY